VITTNRQVKEILISRYKFLTYHDIEIIPQGFDPEDLARAREALAASGSPPSTRMRITYAGIFWEDRVPDHFLQALHDLFQERPKLRGRIDAVFVGNFREENTRLVAHLGLQDSVKVLGYLPHGECLRHVLASDVVWMTVGDNVGSPGKTYEYIGAGKPILGLAPEGFIRSAILEAGGRVVLPTDVGGIKQALAAFYNEYEHHALKTPPPEVMARYDRVALTGNLVRIFESLLAP
jgi:glycosyltransferase involved in cell wall biosynthesis